MIVVETFLGGVSRVFWSRIWAEGCCAIWADGGSTMVRCNSVGSGFSCDVVWVACVTPDKNGTIYLSGACLL